MINYHQIKLIVIIGLPKFGGYTQVVITVSWFELIASNFVPLLCGFNPGCANRIDSQTNCGTPRHRIFNELHLLAIEGEKKWTRTF